MEGVPAPLPWKIINYFSTIKKLFCGLLALKHIVFDTSAFVLAAILKSTKPQRFCPLFVCVGVEGGEGVIIW